MNSYINRKESPNSFRNKKGEFNSILKLNGSKILTNSLDKNKYKNSPHKNLEIYDIIKNNQLLTISNESLPSYKKLPLYKKALRAGSSMMTGIWENVAK